MLWRVVEDAVDALVAGDDHLVVVFDEWMTAFDPSTGEQRWSVPLAHRGGVRIGLLDGQVHLDVDGRHRVLSVVTGEDVDGAVWSAVRCWPPYRHPGYHVLASDDHDEDEDEVVALGVAGERWRSPAGGDDAVAVEAGEFVLVSSRSGLRVLRRETGELVGQIRVRSDFDPRPAISDGERAWVALVDGSVWGLSLTGEGEPLPEPDPESGVDSPRERVPLDRLAGALGLAPDDLLARRAATRSVDEPTYLAAIVDWAGATLSQVLGVVDPLGSVEVTTEIATTRGAWLSTAWDLPAAAVDVDLTDDLSNEGDSGVGEPGVGGSGVGGSGVGDLGIGELAIGEAADLGSADGRLMAPLLWRLFAEAATGGEPVRHRRDLLVAGSEALAFHADDVPIERYGNPFGYLNACGATVVRPLLWHLGTMALDVAAGVSQEEPYKHPEGWDGGRAADLAAEAILRTPLGWDDPFGDGLRVVRDDPECGWPALEQWLLEHSDLDDVEPLLDEARDAVAELVPDLRRVLRMQVLALLAAAAVARVAGQLPPAGRAELLDRARRRGRDALAALIG